MIKKVYTQFSFFVIFALSIISVASATTSNLYLQKKIKASTIHQLAVFSVNATNFCKQNAQDIGTCLNKMAIKQIDQLFNPKPGVEYGSCLKKDDYCYPASIFGPFCCSNLACVGLPPFYNLYQCKPVQGN